VAFFPSTDEERRERPSRSWAASSKNGERRARLADARHADRTFITGHHGGRPGVYLKTQQVYLMHMLSQSRWLLLRLSQASSSCAQSAPTKATRVSGCVKQRDIWHRTLTYCSFCSSIRICCKRVCSSWRGHVKCCMRPGDGGVAPAAP
jgi:hypothetical protein